MPLPYKTISKNFDIVLNENKFWALHPGTKFMTKTAFNCQDNPDILVKFCDGFENNSINLSNNKLGYVPSDETVYMICSVND